LLLSALTTRLCIEYVHRVVSDKIFDSITRAWAAQTALFTTKTDNVHDHSATPPTPNQRRESALLQIKWFTIPTVNSAHLRDYVNLRRADNESLLSWCQRLKSIENHFPTVGINISEYRGKANNVHAITREEEETKSHKHEGATPPMSGILRAWTVIQTTEGPCTVLAGVDTCADLMSR